MSRADEKSREPIGDKDWQALTDVWCHQNPPIRPRSRIAGFWGAIVGPENLWSGPRSTRAQGPCRGRYLPRTNRERPKCLGAQPRMTLSSAFQDFKGKSNISLKVAPKKPPKEEASRMGPTWGYGVELVQGKYVPFALNAPANVLTILMRKDAWTGWLQSSQLTKSKGRQLMGRVLK